MWLPVELAMPEIWLLPPELLVVLETVAILL